MACCAGQISQLTCSVELGIQIAITRELGDLDGLQPPLTTGVLCLRRKSRRKPNSLMAHSARFGSSLDRSCVTLR